MTKTKKLVTAIVLYVVIAIVVAALIAGTVVTSIYFDLVTQFFGEKTYKVVDENGNTIDIDYYKSDYRALKDLQAYEAELAEQIQSEGSVLLRNNGALPLKKSPKVTILGVGSSEANFLYGGGGSGAIDTKYSPNLKEAFEGAGYTVNPTLWTFYKSGAGKSGSEVARSAYSATETGSFSSYHDAAIVVISRAGQESADLSTGIDRNGNPLPNHALELTANELDLVRMANENFDKVIVVLNTMNAMELGTLENGDTAVDAVLWVGAGGQVGLNAIPKVLDGTLTPSGRLVDTYAYDAFSSPAMQNFGTFTVNGAPSTGSRSRTQYVAYAEGIYVGYRYYETRYYDAVTDAASKATSTAGAFASAGGWKYAEEVQYPFGYGLSYSEFEYSDFEMTEKADGFDVSVKVTNKSDTKDKAVVQIYMQSPFTGNDKDHGVEKSAIELVGFGKTKEIGKNGSDTVTVNVPKELMRAWDSEANNGKGGYIVDAGQYYFAFGTDAHDALNNILSKQGKSASDGMTGNGNAAFVGTYTQNALDSTTYNVGADGKQIENRFGDIDLATYDPDYTYLSRTDWEATWPAKAGEMTITETDDLYKVLYNDVFDVVPTDATATVPATGTTSDEYGTLALVSLMNVDYADKKWDALVSQMTAAEQETLFRVGGYATKLMESVSKPATVDKDGPAGISASLVGGAGAFGYPIEVVIASTWNEELAEEVGDCVGEDGYWTGVSGWYAPSMNTHRTPFAGRNFEYYSEDGFIGGVMGAATVKGAQSKGVYCYMKHFAFNDQESGRNGIMTFTNEQAAREIYLRPFEYTVRDGDCRAVMVAMNRMGPVWVGAHKGLMTDTLRDEWGFKGMSITDQASTGGYYPYKTALINGLDMMLNTNNTLWALPDGFAEDATYMTALHRANKNILYTVVHSNAMNGISVNGRIVPNVPAWQCWLIVLDVVLGLASVAGLFFVTWCLVLGKSLCKKAVKSK